MSTGTNFGLNDSLEYNEFEFDSLDATQSYDQDFFTTDWPSFYMGKPLSNVAAVKILEAQIPFSFYIFNRFNNTFELTEVVNGIQHSSTVTIPIGNYNAQTILSQLSSSLNLASTSNGNNFIYTTIFNPSTLKLTITNNDTSFTGDYFFLSFGLDINDNGQKNPRLPLGFAGGQNLSSLYSTGNYSTLIAPSVIQLSGANYLYICSRALGALIHLYVPGNSVQNPGFSGVDGPQIAKIPMTEDIGCVCNWKDPDPLKWFDLGNSQFTGVLDLFCILGTSNLNQPVEFNGAGFSIKLGVLTNKSSHNDWLGGGKQNNNVSSRTWQTGSNPFIF